MPRDRSPAPVRRAVRLALHAATVLALASAVACAPRGTPARSPFDDRGPAPTAPPGVTSFPPSFATPTLTLAPAGPTPAGGAGGAGGAGDGEEAAAGAAIEALARRMGVVAVRLSVVRVEAVDWPDGCLGAALLGIACTQAVTPGYRVVLRYDTGSTHEMRTGRGGASAWAAQSTYRATVQQAERADGPLALTDGGSSGGGRALSVLITPGTQRIGVAVGSLKAGDRVVFGADDLRDGSPLRAVWIARDGG